MAKGKMVSIPQYEGHMYVSVMWACCPAKQFPLESRSNHFRRDVAML